MNEKVKRKRRKAVNKVVEPVVELNVTEPVIEESIVKEPVVETKEEVQVVSVPKVEEPKKTWCSVCQRGQYLTEDNKCKVCFTKIKWCPNCKKIQCFTKEDRCFKCGTLKK